MPYIKKRHENERILKRAQRMRADYKKMREAHLDKGYIIEKISDDYCVSRATCYIDLELKTRKKKT